jgi:hypothetical protein
MSWSLVNRKTGERRYYASGGFATAAARKMGAHLWSIEKSGAPHEVVIAPFVPPVKPAPKRSNYHAYLRPPGDRETPAAAPVAVAKGAQYLLANSLILFAAVVGTKRAYDFAMANMAAARAADNRGAR